MKKKAPPAAKKKVLGRGIGALIDKKKPSAENIIVPAGSSLREIDIDKIQKNEYQPRLDMDETTLNELAASIKEQGVIQPLIVREHNGTFQLIAGERRLRASQIAGLSKVPVIIKNVSNDRSLEIALIENIQRSDLNPMEEALGYQRLASEFVMTQDEIAVRVGKSRAAVANTMRLLKLPPVVQEKIKNGELKEGHAKLLLSIQDPKTQLRIMKKIISENMSVRAIEQLLIKEKNKTPKIRVLVPKTDNLFLALEDKLQRKLGTLVKIHYKNSGKGCIEIEYYSNEDFERIMDIIGLSE